MSSESEKLIEFESNTESFSNLKQNDEIVDIPDKSNENGITQQVENGNVTNLEKPELNNAETVENELLEDSSKASGDDSHKKENQIGEWQDLLGSGGIMKKILVEGKPDTRPQRLERCTINYECTLENGDLIEKEEYIEVLLGDHEVTQGLDLALSLMNVGEKCELKIQSRLAYGSKGLEPSIPPDATVCYTVELVSVDPEEEPESLSLIERKLQGNKKRERGNWWYGRGENTFAVQCYRRALDYLDEVEGGIKYPKANEDQEPTDAALQALLEDRLNVYNNMAAAQIKLNHYDAALNSLQTVLRCQPDNVKALYRKAKIHREKNDLSAALKCLQKANEVSPNNADIQKEMSILNNIIQKQKTTERELARRMFSGPKNSSNKGKGKGERSKLYMWTTIGISAIVGLVGLAAYRFKFTQGI